MSFFIMEGVRADIRHGDDLKVRPEFLLDGLIVVAGPYLERAAHERHVLETVGSVDWFSFESLDEMRFDPGSSLLSSVAFRVPEQTVEKSDVLPTWIPQPGVLRLAELQDFTLKSAGERWVTPESRALMCVYRNIKYFVSGIRAVRIADDLDLLIEDGSLAGWVLHAPYRYLTEEGADPDPVEDPDLEEALSRYLSVVSYPLADRLLDRDQDIRGILNDVMNSISGSDGDLWRRSILKRQIRAVIELNYGSQA